MKRRTMTNLVLAMLYQRLESVLDSTMTVVYEAGEGWRRTGEMGGRRRWMLWRVDWARGILLGKARVAFLDSIFSER